MKYTLAVAALAFLGFAFSQDTANDPAVEAKEGDEARPRIFQRVIPADVLRGEHRWKLLLKGFTPH